MITVSSSNLNKGDVGSVMLNIPTGVGYNVANSVCEVKVRREGVVFIPSEWLGDYTAVENESNEYDMSIVQEGEQYFIQNLWNNAEDGAHLVEIVFEGSSVYIPGGQLVSDWQDHRTKENIPVALDANDKSIAFNLLLVNSSNEDYGNLETVATMDANSLAPEAWLGTYFVSEVVNGETGETSEYEVKIVKEGNQFFIENMWNNIWDGAHLVEIIFDGDMAVIPAGQLVSDWQDHATKEDLEVTLTCDGMILEFTLLLENSSGVAYQPLPTTYTKKCDCPAEN
ncbi:hypothetical protein [Sediminitomix flava]|uniref:Uncharacterized protein n=1 Tax=Sediminitomix flava TaxID=379075 RepID=A0A315ZC57_SEDFL|nr:hypothetical protein [Sediminitomix flava]PWJ43121.1 hypothetical protein BC781_102670 [Sediminitomix flava]